MNPLWGEPLKALKMIRKSLSLINPAFEGNPQKLETWLKKLFPDGPRNEKEPPKALKMIRTAISLWTQKWIGTPKSFKND